MITAKDAKLMSSEKGVDEHLAVIEGMIREACRKKKCEVIMRGQPYDRWIFSGEADRDSVARSVVAALRANGFAVRQHYEEHQFVDLGLHISWKD